MGCLYNHVVAAIADDKPRPAAQENGLLGHQAEGRASLLIEDGEEFCCYR